MLRYENFGPEVAPKCLVPKYLTYGYLDRLGWVPQGSKVRRYGGFHTCGAPKIDSDMLWPSMAPL